MEAVSSHTCLGKSTWQRKGLGDRRLAPMKCCFEASYLGNLWSGIEYRTDWCQVMGLMQWCQRYEFCQSSQHRSIKPDRSIVFHATVDNAMSDANNRCAGNEADPCGEDFADRSIVTKAGSAPG